MSKTSWWRRVFGSEYLSAFGSIYSSERGEKETVFILRQLRFKKGARMLDVACGQGRHAIPFAKYGLRVTGIDASAPLLRAANAAAKKEDVSPIFQKADMRSFELKQRFDAAVILGNAFGYFDDQDNERVIAQIARHLKKHGTLVIDLPNTAGLLRQPFTKSAHKIPDGYV